MFCASVMYPRKEGTKFDFEYFVGSYVPMFVGLLGDNCVRFEVRKGLQQPGAPTPPYVCTANFWVTSAEQFGATLASHGDRIYGEISRFTDLEPTRAWEEVIASSAPHEEASGSGGKG